MFTFGHLIVLYPFSPVLFILMCTCLCVYFVHLMYKLMADVLNFLHQSFIPGFVLTSLVHFWNTILLNVFLEDVTFFKDLNLNIYFFFYLHYLK